MSCTGTIHAFSVQIPVFLVLVDKIWIFSNGRVCRSGALLSSHRKYSCQHIKFLTMGTRNKEEENSTNPNWWWLKRTRRMRLGQYVIYQKLWLILCFCGGISKIRRTTPRRCHERGDTIYKLLLFYTSCRETVNIRKFYLFTEHLWVWPTSLTLMSTPSTRDVLR